MLDLKNGQSCTKKILLLEETNLSIQFCLNNFLPGFKKSLYLGFLVKYWFLCHLKITLKWHLKILDLKNGQSCTKKLVLPNKTNLSIQLCLNYFLSAFKKSLYLAFLRVFFCDFVIFSFSVAKISAFQAIPKVPIPGYYTAKVIKWRENKNRKIFIFGQYTAARKWDFRSFFKSCGYFFA